MPVTVLRSLLPAVPGEDAAAELFGILHREYRDAPAAFLDSSDHARTPQPHRSRYSVLAFSLGEAAEVVLADQGPAGWERFFDDRHQHDDGGSPAPAGRGTPQPSPPFQLGWVGHTSFEGDSRFFRATHAVVFDHSTGAVESQTLAEDAPWDQRVHEAIAVLRQPASSDSGMPVVSEVTVRDQHQQYLDKIRAVQREIYEGNTYEACLTTAVTGRLHADPWDAYEALRVRNRAPFTQFQWFPGADGVAVLSTSPERFVEITGHGTIRSEPIKGTRPRGRDAAEDADLAADLASHPKDRAENVMIADLVRNDLSRHSIPGTLRTERLCAVESYPTVHQMVSTISATLEPAASPARACHAAFPAGSMTGAPKRRTMEILRELEQAPRGVYSGAAGYISTTGASDTSVLIRTAVLHSADGGEVDGECRHWAFHLGVGGAVVADSVPEEEWREIAAKAAGVLGAWGAEFPETGSFFIAEL